MFDLHRPGVRHPVETEWDSDVEDWCASRERVRVALQEPLDTVRAERDVPAATWSPRKSS
jgi:hypothetical protein